ncbi:MAG: helix-turn-helix domain-containing protein [Ruminococcaceae bacterium]|nr:helix-turn-helix domain-containing protein [Oscillospiraceae bacterium]
MITNNAALCEIANDIKLNLYSFGYATVKSTWNGYVKNPVFSRLYYIVGGKACIEHDGEKIELLPQNWYLLPAGFSFNFCCENMMEHIFFHITLSGADAIDMLGRCIQPIFRKDDTDWSVFYKKYLTSENIADSLVVKQKVYDALIKLLKSNNISLEIVEFSECVQKAVEFIKNNLDKKICLSSVAEYAYISKSTLTNKFKKELKITVQEYIKGQKMFAAAQLLKNANMSIEEISEYLGFSDQFYFSKCFKQRFGMSPLKYKKSKIN